MIDGPTQEQYKQVLTEFEKTHFINVGRNLALQNILAYLDQLDAECLGGAGAGGKSEYARIANMIADKFARGMK